MAHWRAGGRMHQVASGSAGPGLACAGMVAALCALGACGPPTVSLEAKTHAYTPADYESVYKLWTRNATPFDFERLESIARVTATFESRAFRWAYVVRYARDLGLTIDERNALLEATLADARKHHRFFVTLAAGHRDEEVDLTHDRSAWRVLLMDDRGHQTRPSQIERIRRPTPVQRRYFPTATSQRRAFRIAFPVRAEDGHLTIPKDSLFALLRFTGPRGTVDLSWNFPPDERRRRRLRERKERREPPL